MLQKGVSYTSKEHLYYAKPILLDAEYVTYR